MFRFEVQYWWAVGHGGRVVKAWTRNGAMREARRLAKIEKPKADIIGVCVL